MENKIKLLIVEDEISVAKILKTMLETEGYDITEASDGKEAQRILNEKSFDIVLTDWMMPQINGIELTEWIHKNSDPAPSIVMLTALAMKAAEVIPTVSLE